MDVFGPREYDTRHGKELTVAAARTGFAVHAHCPAQDQVRRRARRVDLENLKYYNAQKREES
jgi:hypothetical protein